MDTMRRLAIDIRPQLDAEQLVYDQLNHDWPHDRYPGVWVETQLDMRTDAHAYVGLVVYTDVGNPTQLDRGLWRFPLSLTVMGDAQHDPSGFAARVYEAVMAWPFNQASQAGRVSSVTSFSAFQRTSQAKENGGKNITEYSADLVIEARDLFDPRQRISQ